MSKSKEPNLSEKFAKLIKAYTEGKINEENYKRLRDEYRNVLKNSKGAVEELTESRPFEKHLRWLLRPSVPKTFRLILLVVLAVSVASVGAYGYYRIVVLEHTVTESSKRILTMNETIKALEDAKADLAGRVSVLQHYNLSRPTLEQLRQFLNEDPTDKNYYGRGSYVCINFAKDLKQAAVAKHWNLSYVIVNYYLGSEPRGGHAFNGAILADGRHIFIEPQNDRIYSSMVDVVEDLENTKGVSIIESVEVW
jgi:hypothetical protein